MAKNKSLSFLRATDLLVDFIGKRTNDPDVRVMFYGSGRYLDGGRLYEFEVSWDESSHHFFRVYAEGEWVEEFKPGQEPLSALQAEQFLSGYLHGKGYPGITSFGKNVAHGYHFEIFVPALGHTFWVYEMGSVRDTDGMFV